MRICGKGEFFARWETFPFGDGPRKISKNNLALEMQMRNDRCLNFQAQLIPLSCTGAARAVVSMEIHHDHARNLQVAR